MFLSLQCFFPFNVAPPSDKSQKTLDIIMYSRVLYLLKGRQILPKFETQFVVE